MSARTLSCVDKEIAEAVERGKKHQDPISRKATSITLDKLLDERLEMMVVRDDRASVSV